MARRPKEDAPAPAEHNTALTDDERADLIAYYGDKIRKQSKVAGEAKAAYDLERTEVNSLFAKVKGDLHISRKDFEAVLIAGDMTEAEFRHSEAKRATLFKLAGLPVGAQIDLFNGATDTADDQAMAYANGKRAGLRGDDPIPPDTVSPILHPEWMRGWSDGQGELGQRMMRAMELIQTRGKPSTEEPVDLNAAEEEDPADPETIKKQARKLKNDPAFMDRTAPADDELEAVH